MRGRLAFVVASSLVFLSAPASAAGGGARSARLVTNSEVAACVPGEALELAVARRLGAPPFDDRALDTVTVTIAEADASSLRATVAWDGADGTTGRRELRAAGCEALIERVAVTISVVWIVVPDPTLAKLELQALSLDSFGNVTTPPHVLMTGSGIASHLRASADIDGFAVTYAQQAFASDPADLVLARFDRASRLLGAPSAVARGLASPADQRPQPSGEGPEFSYAFSADFATTTPGGWFAAYAKPTATGSPSTALFGRTVTGATPAIDATK